MVGLDVDRFALCILTDFQVSLTYHNCVLKYTNFTVCVHWDSGNKRGHLKKRMKENRN